MRAFSAMLCLIPAAGCASGLELSVDVRSDLRPGEEVDEAVVAWERAGQELGRQSLRIGPGDDLVDGVRLVDLAGLAEGTYRVRVVLRRGGEDVGARSRAFRLDGDRAITLVITRACRDDACEPPPCRSAVDCVREVACMRAECIAAVCLSVPDDAACPDGRCDPVSGCGPGLDGGMARLDAGARDGGPPSDGGGTCAVVDCSNPACAGMACDDADPCTHTDRCDEGACAGTPITCPSDDCVTRTCNGTATCDAVPVADGTACSDDGNECTDDVCRAGVCAHEARPDGYGLGGFRMCCGGAAVDTSTDRDHCGGCGLRCAGSFPCTMHTGRPTCDCTANTDCQGGVGWLCSTTWDLVCACTSDAGCPGTSRCVERTGPDYCEYPP